jgi:outer membrane protein
MMKKTIIFSIFLLVLGAGTAMAQPKFGHINSEELLAKTEDYKGAEAELQRFRTEKVQEIEEMKAHLQKKAAQFEIDEPTLTELVKQSRYKELQEYQAGIQNFSVKAEEKFAEKQNELMTPLLAQLKAAVAKVAKDNGYTYVFDSQVLHYAGGEDISELVMKEFNTKTP